jgi:FG-GAP-like repeat
MLLSISLGLVAALVAGAVAFYRRYPGFTRSLYCELRYATFTEHKNLFAVIRYWTEYMGYLRFDPDTGLYNFERADRRGLDAYRRGVLEYHRGRFPDAIALIEQDIGARGETQDKVFWLAMSYLRQAEAENCLRRLTAGPESGAENGDAGPCPCRKGLCCLPLTRHHTCPGPALAAAGLFERLLTRYDSHNYLYKWLLNFCHMTAGGFPDRVPPEHVLGGDFADTFSTARRDAVRREHPDLILEEQARELGVDVLQAGRGVAVEDFDNDGYLDLVVTDSFGELRYFQNDRGLRFLDRTKAVGLAGVKQAFILTAADYDNDGWMDLFISRPFGTFALFKNNGDGTFTDVTEASGLLDGKREDEIAATWISAWGDVNNDGHLDLFLAQWGFKMPFGKGLLAKPRMDSKLFVYEHGRFVDRTAEYGLSEVVKDQYFVGAAFGDYDGDGYPDLFLSSPLRNTSVLLKNVGGKRFERTRLVPRTEGGFVCCFLDVNHDGRLDIFQSGFGDARTNTELAVFGKNRDRYRSCHSTIFVQDAQGRFHDRHDLFDVPMSTMGASYGDVNNDGLFDFYLGTGTPEGWFILPNLFYLSEAEGTRFAGRMTNVSMLEGLGTIQKGHGIVFFDFNNDGREDVFSSLGGMWPGDVWRSQLFVNKSTTANSWVKFRLRGRRTNRFGVGATLRVVGENDRREEIVRYCQIDNKTGFGSSPYLAHVGLMDAVRLKAVEVYWPVSRQWRGYAAELRTLNVLDEAGGRALPEKGQRLRQEPEAARAPTPVAVGDGERQMADGGVWP